MADFLYKKLSNVSKQIKEILVTKRNNEPIDEKAENCFLQLREICGEANDLEQQYKNDVLSLAKSGMAEIKLLLENKQHCYRLLSSSISLSPKNSAALRLKGNLLYSDKKHEEALSCFRSAASIDGKLEVDANFWMAIGLCLFQLNKFEEAETAFSKATNLVFKI
ncbi:protein required for normal CLN1 and CLN2 G1 cyclin expression, variant 2 [Bonamia ostreae]|uniref:Protein required for normal CLN1 and CLN2 G1 cyclin expression, variant 2 n=1 Tax=Bonamia ostreae TaxID=126728 RepID=A0ABV2APG0_9EUKA